MDDLPLILGSMVITACLAAGALVVLFTDKDDQ